MPETDISIIRNMMRVKPVKYISLVIDQPQQNVIEMIMKLCAEEGLTPYPEKKRKSVKIKREPRPISGKQIKREKELKSKQLDQKQRNIAERMRIDRQRALERRRPEETFSTRKIDYKEKVMLRIDRNTYIYAEVGKEKQAKEDFLKIYKGTNLK